MNRTKQKIRPSLDAPPPARFARAAPSIYRNAHGAPLRVRHQLIQIRRRQILLLALNLSRRKHDTTTLGISISSSTAAPPSEHIPLWWRCCFFAAWSD
jgi:hypothetical protein